MLRNLSIAIARSLPTPLRHAIHANASVYRAATRLFGALVGSQPATIPSGVMRGLKLAPSRHISHAHLTGTYESGTLEAIDSLLEPGMVCYDVGASVGYITIGLARKASRVFAFEPSPEAQRELERQVAVNGFKNVELVKTPLSGDVRTVKFAITDAAYGSGINDTQNRWPTLELQTSTLDLFSQSHPAPDLIKVDIEGEEAVLFEGATQLLQNKRPKIVCELHSEAAARAVMRAMERARYRVLTLDRQLCRINAPVIAGELQVICLPC